MQQLIIRFHFKNIFRKIFIYKKSISMLTSTLVVNGMELPNGEELTDLCRLINQSETWMKMADY